METDVTGTRTGSTFINGRLSFIQQGMGNSIRDRFAHRKTCIWSVPKSFANRYLWSGVNSAQCKWGCDCLSLSGTIADKGNQTAVRLQSAFLIQWEDSDASAHVISRQHKLTGRAQRNVTRRSAVGGLRVQQCQLAVLPY